jgi:hypothetical protein
MVPSENLDDLSGTTWPLRSTYAMKSVYDKVQDLLSHRGNKARAEAILKENGLYNVEVRYSRYHNADIVLTPCVIQNAFWKLENSDPYTAYTHDDLHSDDLGKLRHMWGWLSLRIGGGSNAEVLTQKCVL